MASNIIALVRDGRIIAMIEEGTLTKADLAEGDSLVDIPDDQPAELGWAVIDGRAIQPVVKR